MTKKSATIVFFGSGPVAAKSLEFLAKHFDIEAVITKPRPTHHRSEFPMLELSNRLKLTVFTVTNKVSLDELIDKDKLTSRLAVLVDFGIIVSQKVIDYFPFGIINSHFSLLPEWRGADPITFSVLSGQRRSGISLMLLTEPLDEGPLLAQTPYDMPADITTPQLTENLIDINNRSLLTIIPLWLKGEIEAMPQSAVSIADNKEPSYSRKLTKQDGNLDWQKPARQLEREIRAFAEWPKSRTMLAGKEVIITGAHAETKTIIGGAPPGKTIVTKNELCVTTAEGSLCIDRLKPAGKPEMTAEAFLAGYGDKIGRTANS